jgi:uncharacterized protein YkwD
MRTAHLYGVLSLALVATALFGVLGESEPDPAPVAYQPPLIQINPTTTEATTTTTTPSPAERKPDVDVLGVSVGDLVATTTTPPAANAPAPGADTSTSTTVQPSAADTSTSTTASTVATGPNGELEAQFAAKINGLRSASGLAPLTRDGSLDAMARAWAEQMAGNGGLSHSNLGSLLPPWSAAAENVAMGGSVDSVFAALAASSGHLTNMLGDYTHVGVGVWVDSSGSIWTTHIFTR